MPSLSTLRLLSVVGILAILQGCATPPTVPKSGAFRLPAPQSVWAPVELFDERPSPTASANPEEGVVEFKDADFKPSPASFVAAALAAELAAHEWHDQARRWLGGKRIVLLGFNARSGRQFAKNVDSKTSSSYAAISPAGPAIGYAMQLLAAELSREGYLELEIRVQVGDHAFDGRAKSLVAASTEDAFVTMAEEVVRSIARQIADESVGLGLPRQSGRRGDDG